MQEGIVPRSEDDIDGVDVGQYQSYDDFSGHAEVHVEVVHALGEDGLSSGLADDVVEQLADEVGVEVARLSVFYGFGCEADWAIGVGRNLLDSAGSILEVLGKD